MTKPKKWPGPSAWTAYPNVRRFVSNRADFMMGLWKQYGDLLRFRLGLYDVYMVNRPELIKEVLMNHAEFPKTPALRFLRFIIGEGLLISGGEFHKRQRRLMQPAFTPARITTYCDTMVECVEETATRWQDGREIDVHQEMTRLTMEVAARTMFGARVGKDSDPIGDAINVLLPFADRIAQPTGFVKMFLPAPSNFRFRRALQEVNRLIYRFIEDRRASGEDKGDVLSMLIAAQDTEGDGGRMTDKQVRDEAITLFLAGHETTAVALSWTWYLLSQHPEVEATLHEELERVLGGRVPQTEDVPKLEYTRRILSESMRLYPPAYLLDRLTTKDWPAGDYVVPKGKYVFVSPYIMHRHPEFWPEPEKFDPERWTPEAVKGRPKFAYFPFGGGPRICIGEHLAWTEMTLVLGTLAQRWRLVREDSDPVRFAPLITLRPKGGIRFRLQARHHAAVALSK